MSPGARLLQRLEAASPPSVGTLAIAVTLLLGVADVLTGAEVSSSVFYALPVSVAAWYAGWRWGVGLGVLAALTWYLADDAAGATYSAAWIPVWNAAVRLAFFLIIGRLLVLLRHALETQRALAEMDALTGLANSRRFLAAVANEATRSLRYRRPVSLAYLDLDGFKAVNDRFGHAVGDDVLEAVGRTLREQVRASDLPARLGGDEFAVLFPETGGDAARDAAEKVQGALLAAMAVHRWPVGFSVGVVTSEGDVGDAEELVRQADALMYEVKRTGKGRVTHRKALPPASS